MIKRSEEYNSAEFEEDTHAYLLLDILRTLEEIRDKSDSNIDVVVPIVFNLEDAPKDPIEGQSWEWKPGFTVEWVAGNWRTKAELRYMAEFSVLAFLQGTPEATPAEVARSTGLSQTHALDALARLVSQKQVIRFNGDYRLAAGDTAEDVQREVEEFEASLDHAEKELPRA